MQGGIYPDLRQESAERLVAMDFPGYAIGGLAVGEPKPLMYEVIEQVEPYLPEERPRYLMGVGTPADLVEAWRWAWTCSIASCRRGMPATAGCLQGTGTS